MSEVAVALYLLGTFLMRELLTQDGVPMKPMLLWGAVCLWPVVVIAYLCRRCTTQGDR